MVAVADGTTGAKVVGTIVDDNEVTIGRRVGMLVVGFFVGDSVTTGGIVVGRGVGERVGNAVGGFSSNANSSRGVKVPFKL